MSAIYTALLKAQQALKSVAKSSTNPHFKSSYAPFEDVLHEALRVLNDNGIFLTQGTDAEDESGFNVVTTMIHAESGESLVSRVRVPLEKPSAQGAGSALTYGCRYGLRAALGMRTGDEDDDGHAATVERPLTTAEKIAIAARNAPLDKLPAALQENADRVTNAYRPEPVKHVLPRTAEQVRETMARGPQPIMPGKAGLMFRDRNRRPWAGEPIGSVPLAVLEEARDWMLGKANDPENKYAEKTRVELHTVETELNRRRDAERAPRVVDVDLDESDIPF